MEISHKFLRGAAIVGRIGRYALIGAATLINGGSTPSRLIPYEQSGFQVYGAVDAGFIRQEAEIYGTLPSGMRDYLKKNGVTIALADIRDDADPEDSSNVGKISSDPNETRTHQNQANGVYYGSTQTVVLTRFEATARGTVKLNDRPAPQTLAPGQWREVGRDEQLGVMRHEFIGHGLDFTASFPSHSYGFFAAVQKDLAAKEGGAMRLIYDGVDSYEIRQNAPYSGLQEMFAEVAAGLLGGGSVGTYYADNYPETAAWVKKYQAGFEAAYAQGRIDDFIRDYDRLPAQVVEMRTNAAHAALEKAGAGRSLAQLVAFEEAVDVAIGMTPEARALLKMAGAEYAATAESGDPFYLYYDSKLRDLMLAAPSSALVFVNLLGAKIAWQAQAKANYERAWENYDWRQFGKKKPDIDNSARLWRDEVLRLNTPTALELFDRVDKALSSNSMAVYGGKGQDARSIILSAVELLLMEAARGKPTDAIMASIQEKAATLSKTPALRDALSKDIAKLPEVITAVAEASAKHELDLFAEIQRGIAAQDDPRLVKALADIDNILRSNDLTEDGKFWRAKVNWRLLDVVRALPMGERSYVREIEPNDAKAWDRARSNIRTRYDGSAIMDLSSEKKTMPSSLKSALDAFQQALQAYSDGLTIESYNNKVIDRFIVDMRHDIVKAQRPAGLIAAYDDVTALFSTPGAKRDPSARLDMYNLTSTLVSIGASVSYTDRFVPWVQKIKEAAPQYIAKISDEPLREQIATKFDYLAEQAKTDFADNHVRYLEARLASLNLSQWGFDAKNFPEAFTAYQEMDRALMARTGDVLALEARVDLRSSTIFSWRNLDAYSGGDGTDEKARYLRNIKEAQEAFTKYRESNAHIAGAEQAGLNETFDLFERAIWRDLKRKHPAAAALVDAQVGELRGGARSVYAEAPRAPDERRAGDAAAPPPPTP